MQENERRFTATQEIKLRQLVRISKLLYDLEMEFYTQGKVTLQYQWMDQEGHQRVESISSVFLAGMRKIRNNIYLALGQDGCTKEANMIVQNYLTPHDITVRDKFQQKSPVD